MTKSKSKDDTATLLPARPETDAEEAWLLAPARVILDSEFSCKRKRALSPQTLIADQNPGGLAPNDHSAEALRSLTLTSLDDDKALDVTCIDLTGKSPVTDVMIIASGRSNRHVSAMAEHLLRQLKEAGYGRAKVEGMPACDWVLIDAGDVVVHLFRPEVRAFYNLEKMWAVEPAEADEAEVAG